MLRVSKLTDYAIAVMVHLSKDPVVQTAPGIAGALGLPEPTVSKVLKLLAGASLVTSQRGARGGYRLVLPLRDIAVGSVVVAIDGPVALTACVEGAGLACEVEASCPVRGRWEPVNEAVKAALERLTLADIAAPPNPIQARSGQSHRNAPPMPAEAAHQPEIVSS